MNCLLPCARSTRSIRFHLVLLLGIAAAGVLPVAEGFANDEWPEFRGPTGQGIATGEIPVQWSESENVQWKVPVPGLAWSSPVVADDRIYLTTAVEPEDAAAPLVSLQLHCLSLADGSPQWSLELFTHPGARQVEMHSKNSHASPTPIVEGGRIYAHFGPHGTACVTTAGEVVWKNEELDYRPTHGNGGSPALFQDRLIICCDGSDEQFVVALDKATGKQLWRTDRDVEVSRGFSFCTPTLIEVNGQMQAVCPGSGAVSAYDPETGEEIWRVDYGVGYSVVPRPVYAEGLVFVCSGYGDESLYAIDPTGRGNITETHVKWSASRNVPQNPSLLYRDGLLFSVSDRGIATCYEAATGKVLWLERLGGRFSASPLYANGLVYFQDEEGLTTVIRSSDEFEEVATSELGEGKKRTYASFAIVGNRILLRSESHLYCLGE